MCWFIHPIGEIFSLLPMEGPSFRPGHHPQHFYLGYCCGSASAGMSHVDNICHVQASLCQLWMLATSVSGVTSGWDCHKLSLHLRWCCKLATVREVGYLSLTRLESYFACGIRIAHPYTAISSTPPSCGRSEDLLAFHSSQCMFHVCPLLTPLGDLWCTWCMDGGGGGGSVWSLVWMGVVCDNLYGWG